MELRYLCIVFFFSYDEFSGISLDTSKTVIKNAKKRYKICYCDVRMDIIDVAGKQMGFFCLAEEHISDRVLKKQKKTNWNFFTVFSAFYHQVYTTVTILFEKISVFMKSLSFAVQSLLK